MEFLVLGIAGVDLAHGFVAAEDNVFVAAAVGDFIRGPVRAGAGLLVGIDDKLHKIAPLFAVPGLDAERGDLKRPRVGHIGVGPIVVSSL